MWSKYVPFFKEVKLGNIIVMFKQRKCIFSHKKIYQVNNFNILFLILLHFFLILYFSNLSTLHNPEQFSENPMKNMDFNEFYRRK